MSTLWDRTVAELRETLPSQEFTTWISSLSSGADQDDGLLVEAPSVFHRNWVQQRYLERIRTAAQAVAGHPVAVRMAIAGGGALRAVAAKDHVPTPAPIRVPARQPGTATLTFERFVVGPCNELAYGAARAVAEAPGQRYNPLFLYGGVGLGKTHLLHAAANAVRTGFPSFRVLAIDAERFINEMVGALRRQQMEMFHQRFRRVDMLLVDDIQFIAGKERTQEEFFHAFNLLCAAGKQIVLSSDKPPAAISNLEAGLRSRFEGGMIAELTRPDRDTRHRIIERKSVWAGFPLPADVVDFLTDRVPAVSVREIEGALVRLQAIASLGDRPIDLALAESAIVTSFSGGRERLSAERVEALVAGELAVESRLLRSPKRNARVVFARQVAMYLMRRQLGLPFAAIGERYGRDHTTVLHAVRTIEAQRACNPEVRRLVTALEEKL